MFKSGCPLPSLPVCPLQQHRLIILDPSPFPLTWHVPDDNLNANLRESHYPALCRFGTVDCADPAKLSGKLICILTHGYAERRFKRAIHHRCEVRPSAWVTEECRAWGTEANFSTKAVRQELLSLSPFTELPVTLDSWHKRLPFHRTIAHRGGKYT